jgi:NADPH:quinone reductase
LIRGGKVLTKAIRYHENGGPEVLRWEDVELRDPGANDVRIHQTAIGLNFIEINTRAGRWGFKPAQLPFVPGLEGVGVIAQMGSAVKGFSAGQRVCFASGSGRHSYARDVIVGAESVIPVPDAISDRDAAALIFRGLTAYMLVRQIRPVQPGETVLVHGASGGIAYIASQWARHLGARVIGTVSDERKAAFAKAHGCDEVINYSKEDFVARVKELTKGRGVDIVYDGVGQAVLDGSLLSLAKCGMMINYGQTSGPSKACDIDTLGNESLFFTRPKLHDYIVDENRLSAARAVFEVALKGHVKIEIGSSFPLERAADAHRERERRTVMGSMILVP